MIGRVVSGGKKAAKFIAMEEYRKEFKRKIGINPYPGTLNLIVDKKEYLSEIDGIYINGFTKNGKRFGGVKCFPAIIEHVKCAVIIPEKSKEKYVEVISSYNLRRKLNLKDGDTVKLNFIPFVKKRKKLRMDCEGGKIKIYYDKPTFKKPLMEECGGDGRRLLPPFPVACLIFEEGEKENYEKLMRWIRKKGYSIMYPPVLISHGKLKEWQIEIKWNPA